MSFYCVHCIKVSGYPMHVIAIAVLWLCAATSVQARDLFEFNGSVVEMSTEGQQMLITYVKPGRGLPSMVGPGSLVFEGGINERSRMLEGYVYTYDACGRQKSWVSGSEIENGRVVELVGLVGLRNRQRCREGGFIDRTTFRFVRQSFVSKSDEIMGMPAKKYIRGVRQEKCMPSPSGACGGE